MPCAKIAVVGSRDLECVQAIETALERLLEANGEFTLVSGGAQGVDAIAEEWAKRRGLPTEIYEADWDGLGDKAGIKRNGQIVAAADVIIVFWDGVSTGTLDSIKKAKTAKKGVRVYLC